MKGYFRFIFFAMSSESEVAVFPVYPLVRFPRLENKNVKHNSRLWSGEDLRYNSILEKKLLPSRF